MAMRRWFGRSEVHRGWQAACALVIAAIAVAGCPFEPREPNPPAALTACDSIQQQNNPNDVRRKIIRAYECKRSSIYAECLSTTFAYVPDAEANNAAPGFFNTWSPAREVASFEAGLLGSDPADEVRMRTFQFADTGELSGDQARYQVQYELRLVLVSGDTLSYGACAIWDFIGVQTFPVFLNRWTDQNAFGSGGCTPLQPSPGTDESSGFLRIRAGVI
jgi:hypothetical protein